MFAIAVVWTTLIKTNLQLHYIQFDRSAFLNFSPVTYEMAGVRVSINNLTERNVYLHKSFACGGGNLFSIDTSVLKH